MTRTERSLVWFLSSAPASYTDVAIWQSAEWANLNDLKKREILSNELEFQIIQPSFQIASNKTRELASKPNPNNLSSVLSQHVSRSEL